MALTGSDEASAAHLERAIIVDPGFTVRLLAQANSAFYALPRKIVSIREAVLFLGFREVRQLAMAVGVFDLFVGKTDRESLRRRGWWKHSLETAGLCRVIAEGVSDVSGDEAYTCGLLHLIGKTLLDRYDSAEYERVHKVVDQGAPDILAERAVFGCDHVAIGLEAATRWRFPESLLIGLNYFAPAEDPTPENRLRAATALASRVVKLKHQLQSGEEIRLDQLPVWALTVLGIDPDSIPELIHRLHETLDGANQPSFT